MTLSIITAHPVARLFPRKAQKGVQACSEERCYTLLPVMGSSVTVPFSKPEWGRPPRGAWAPPLAFLPPSLTRNAAALN